MEVSGSIFSSGISAVQAGQRRVDQAATEIAGAAVNKPVKAGETSQFSDNKRDLATSLVDLQIGKVQVQAGAKVIQTADEVLGTLVDTRA